MNFFHLIYSYGFQKYCKEHVSKDFIFFFLFLICGNATVLFFFLILTLYLKLAEVPYSANLSACVITQSVNHDNFVPVQSLYLLFTLAFLLWPRQEVLNESGHSKILCSPFQRETFQHFTNKYNILKGFFG